MSENNTTEETQQKAPADSELITLTKDEQETVAPAIKRIMALQGEAKLLLDTIEPFIKLIAKNHGIDVVGAKYNLLPDGSAFVKQQ